MVMVAMYIANYIWYFSLWIHIKTTIISKCFYCLYNDCINYRTIYIGRLTMVPLSVIRKSAKLFFFFFFLLFNFVQNEMNWISRKNPKRKKKKMEIKTVSVFCKMLRQNHSLSHKQCKWLTFNLVISHLSFPFEQTIRYAKRIRVCELNWFQLMEHVLLEKWKCFCVFKWACAEITLHSNNKKKWITFLSLMCYYSFDCCVYKTIALL